MRISIRQLVGGGLLLIIVLFVTVVAINGAMVTIYRENVQALAGRVLPQSQLVNQLEGQLAEVNIETLQYVLTGDQQHRDARQAARQRSEELLGEVSASLSQSGDNEATDKAFLVLSTITNRLLTLTDEVVAQPRDDSPRYFALISQLNEAQEQLPAAIELFRANLRGESDQIVAATARNPLVVTRFGVAIVFLLMIAFFFVVSRALVRPLVTLRDATLAVAAGERGSQVPVAPSLELGDLGRAFNAMVARIGEQEASLSHQARQSEAARQEAESARSKVADQLAIIAEQRQAIREMSVPVLPLTRSAIVLPLVGELDGDRMHVIQERALHAIEQNRVRDLIIDITGVPVVDSYVGQGLIQVVQSARLLGAHTLLVGIRPEVAQALVELGLDLSQITTYSSLQSGIAAVLAQSPGIGGR